MSTFCIHIISRSSIEQEKCALVGLTVVNVCAVKNCFDRQVTKYISIKVYTFLYFFFFSFDFA